MSPDSVDNVDSLNSLLEDLRDLDLTGKIIEESPFLKAHGGFSDVFSGKSLQHNGMQVAIKRLRVHVLDNQKMAKVISHLSFESLNIFILTSNP